MDSILKIVYDKWIELGNDKQPLPNGIHPKVYELIKEKLKINQNLHETYTELQKTINGNMILFDHSNFYGYTVNKIKHIQPSEININSNDVYVWPIEIKGDPKSVFESNQLVVQGDKINYKLHETIPNPVLELMRQGIVKVLIHCAQDPYYYININDIESYFSNLGIYGNHVIFVPGNDNTLDYLEHYPNGKLKISAVSLMITQQCARMSLDYPLHTNLGYLSELVEEKDLDSNKIRPNKFICLNRTMRPHRYVMAYHALKNNLLNSNIYTFLNYFNADARNIQGELSKFDIPEQECINYSHKIYKILPYQIDTHGLEENQRGNISINNTKKDWYLQTYLSVVTETSFIDGRKPFISEKLWRPVMNLQPFILVGNYGTLKMIRELGFKTFSPFIDESYDEVYDYNLRMKMIFKEIEKINKMPIEQLHQWYYSITDILIHNLKTLRDLKDIDPYQVLFDDLIQTYGNTKI
jgi:hypothetical protein